MRFPVLGLRRRFSIFQQTLSASCLGEALYLAGASSGSELFKRSVQDRIFLPIAVIKMPPLEWIDEKSFAFHDAAQ